MVLGDDENDYYRGALRPGGNRQDDRHGRARDDRNGAQPMSAPSGSSRRSWWSAALGMLFARKAVHAALLLAVVMISLAILYAVQDAPFLFAVQIIVYTGAIMMLFLFVLMLVGVDASDSLVETMRGQRLAAVVGRRCCSAGAGHRRSARSIARRGHGPRRRPTTDGNVAGPGAADLHPTTSSPSRSPARC